jgi:hypothetical protein
MEWERWGFSHPTKEFIDNPELQEKYLTKYGIYGTLLTGLTIGVIGVDK